MELDDWDLTAEELDALERDAIRQLSHRHASPPRSSSAASPHHTPQKQQQRQFDVASATDGSSFDLSPAKQLADIGRNKVEGSPGPRTLPTSVAPEVTDDHLKELPKVRVKFILHASGNIAVKFPYDQLIVNAVRGVPKASWNAKERLWIFPMSSLPSAEKALGALTAAKVEIDMTGSQMISNQSSSLFNGMASGLCCNMESVLFWPMKWVWEKPCRCLVYFYNLIQTINYP